MKTMVHLNSNILCAVDLNTTGPIVGEHEIYELSVMPLDVMYKMDKQFMPFNTTIRPENPKIVDKKHLSQDKLVKVMRGHDPFTVVDLFEDRFKKLNLPDRKRIMVISYDWPTKSAFLKYLFQPKLFDLYFHEWYRDLIPVSLYLNDNADMNIEPVPYPKSLLTFIAGRLGLPFEDKCDTLNNARTIANCYERIRKRMFQ